MKKQYVFSGLEASQVLCSLLSQAGELRDGERIDTRVESFNNEEGKPEIRFVLEVIPRPVVEDQS